ncbi:MAG: glycosyltransferase family 1 protein, partial [Candidatus Promineifilaceae bacterium]|nr:glycosyltransferase family 1 protein [Candidatus Promineifilaceae bacterium]
QTPFVITIHDASLFIYSHCHPRTRLLSIRLALPFVARRAAAVITVSEHARQDLIRILGLPPEKVHVVYAAAPEHFAPVCDAHDLASVRRKYGLPAQFLLYVGTLEPRKNLRRLVRAMRQIRQYGLPHKLVLVGATGWQIEELYREIEAQEMKDDVLFTGYVPDEDLPALFSLATLFVFPSLYEGFGLPPIEAMACGAPVLSSNRSSLPEVCGDAAYLVNPEDEEELVDALVALLSDGARRAEMTARGLKRAGTFSWRRAARETASIYRSVVQ